MWYSRVVVVPFLFRIGYATSQDGIHWQNVKDSGTDGAVLDRGPEDSFDRLSVAWPAVLNTDNGFTMYYFGFDGTQGGLGAAVSDNGIEWKRIKGKKYKGAVFEEGHYVSVLLEKGMYKMWYGTGQEKIVGYANSMSTNVYNLDKKGGKQAINLYKTIPIHSIRKRKYSTIWQRPEK